MMQRILEAARKPTAVSSREFERAEDNGAGFCATCRRFTAPDGVHPEDDGVECPICHQNTLYGTDAAFTEGVLRIK